MRKFARVCLFGKEDSQSRTLSLFEIMDSLSQHHCGSSNELINQHANTENVPG